MSTILELITSDWIYFWLAVFLVALVVEAISVGLTSIWAAGGALVALLLAVVGAGPVFQILAFFLVTFILLVFTRPWARKYLESKKTATNYEESIGKTVRIIEEVDAAGTTGRADFNGMEWMARAKEPGVSFAAGEHARVAGVTGVKLLLEKLD